MGIYMMDAKTKAAARRRLRRIAGQVAGIERMVEDDRYCIDVLDQVAAVRAALARVSAVLLTSHIETCVAEAFAAGDTCDRDEKIAELVRVMSRSSAA